MTDDTTSEAYALRLERLGEGWGKRALDFQHPNRRNLRRLEVNHNARSVEVARSRGHHAMSSQEFDRLPIAHVLEHMSVEKARNLLKHHAPHTRNRMAAVCSQERGNAIDATHVNLLDGDDIAAPLRDVGPRVRRVSSFPIPRRVGRWFAHNETVVLADRS